MAILTTSGRAALALSLGAQPLHLAWGTGQAGWDSVPEVEPVGATALVAEVGRRGGVVVSYVVADVAGAVILPSGRWTVSVSPTNNLYLRFAFDYADGATALIRELAVFVGTVILPAVLTATPGKLYFPPADLSSPGTLLVLQRIPVIIRSTQTRQNFEFVMTF